MMAKKKKEKIQQSKSKWITVIIVMASLTFLAYLFAGVSDDDYENSDGNIALIKINGLIVSEDGMFASKLITSPDTIKLIKKATKNKKIKAIIFEINSPGGSALASKEIADEIKKVNKTTVAVIREVGTSGAYWIASATDLIVASPISITGSIGVISSHLEFDGFFEKYGINYRRLVAGEHKDIGSPFKEMTEEEEAIMQKQLNKVHDYFIKEIALNRKLKEEDVRKISTGMFYLGEEAQELGLVDMLGNKDSALSLLEETFDIENAKVVEYKEEKSFLDSLFDSFSQQSYNAGSEFRRGVVSNDVGVRT
jgi:protease IV